VTFFDAFLNKYLECCKKIYTGVFMWSVCKECEHVYLTSGGTALRPTVPSYIKNLAMPLIKGVELF